MTQPSLFRVAARSMRLMGGCVFLAVGMVFLLVVGNALLAEHRYQTAAKDLTAVVVVKNLRRATATTSTKYDITYRVSPAGQPAFERTEVVPVGTWDALEPASGIQVQYVPGDPESTRVSQPSSVWPLALVATLGAGLALAGGWLTAGGVRTTIRTLRIARHGQAAEASTTAASASIPTNRSEASG